jgi:hypothetical protein
MVRTLDAGQNAAFEKRRAEARLLGEVRRVRPDTDAPNMEGTKDTKILLMMIIHPVGCIYKPPPGMQIIVVISGPRR